jgi:hypothetical protein
MTASSRTDFPGTGHAHKNNGLGILACTVLTTGFEVADVSSLACIYFIVSKECVPYFMAYVPVATCDQCEERVHRHVILPSASVYKSCATMKGARLISFCADVGGQA